LGARLLLVARNYDKLEQTRESLEGTGHRSESFDLSETDDIESWLVSTAREFGRLDGLVHSAGVLSTSPLRMLSRARIDAMLNVNLIAAIALARAYCSRKVRTDHGGSIVLLASTMGLVGQPGRSAYAASKGGIVALTKSLALELARNNIRVNCIAPAIVNTEMTQEYFRGLSPEQHSSIVAQHPLGIGEPLDVAYGVAYLLGDTGRWVTGTTLVVDGGYTAQ